MNLEKIGIAVSCAHLLNIVLICSSVLRLMLEYCMLMHEIFVPLSSILVSAFGGTALAFGCFSAAALLARRREYLYLGGLLSSGLSILLWLHFASAIFGGSAAIFKFEVRRLIECTIRV